MSELTHARLPAAPNGRHGGLSFLASPGEMGRRIAEYDWTDTPLGDLRAWPQSLRTAVSLMLNSSHPMWIGWGPEATFLYNDAYIDVLSVAKHPHALGRPAAHVWSEIWDFCGPLADKVFRHAEATFVDDVQLFMHRGNWLEETWYSFSYSPIVDESGGVGGLFCPSTNATSSNLNTRRLATLSALSASALREDSVAGACDKAMQTIARNPQDMPFALLYLIDDDGGHARLRQAAHVPAGGDVAPASLPLAGDGAPPRWPVRQVCADGASRVLAVGDLDALPLGLAHQRVTQALALPLAMPGQERPLGVLVLGVSPACRLDGEYRTFFELVAGQVAAALQNAMGAEAQRQRADMLAELDRAKTAFFSNVSHEFRTPLTLMLGPIEDVLSDEGWLPDAQRERLELAHRNALRLQRLVNTLLDFSRVQAGRMQAAYARVDLGALTRDLASGFRSIVEGAGLALEVRCAPLSTPAYVDPALWEKIVLNLLSNAFKFTFEGGIRVTLEQVGGDAVLRVADTGGGIAAEHLEHVFERFRRVDGARSRTHEGTGIGLALVRDLVELHQGGIRVDSELGKGSRFTVTVPLGRAHLRDEQLTQADRPAGGVAAGATLRSYTAEALRWLPERDAAPAPGAGAGPEAADMAAATAVTAAALATASTLAQTAHVLVADDNADMRAYLHRLLRERWSVGVAANGRAALEAARAQPPDLIISDVMMPELDGFGLLAAVRADPALRDTPVLLLSARAGEEARIEGLTAGADDYLVKPFSAKELLTRVDSQLMRHRMRQVESAHASRMAAVFRQAPMAIAILRGPALVFELLNQRFEELVGGREAMGLPFRQAFPDLDGQGMIEELERVYASGQARTGSARRVLLARGPDGAQQECYFDYVHQPILNGAGVVDRVAIVAFEVSELVRARRAAEVANRAKDEFLAMLGHELRNPLSPILIALELMQLKGLGNAEREHAVIERQARHLVRLVDDLLDVARIAQGKIALRPERVELGALLAQAVETVGPLMEARQHSLRLDVAAAGLPVDADPVRFTQVLSNLLTNAAKYTNRGGTIRVAAAVEDGEVALRIQDNGIGIAPDMLPRLFDMFVQERQALDRSQGGLGLGLAIVRSLVELHGGTVRASSAGLGQGSVFELRLPLAGGPSGAASLAAPAAQPGRAARAAPPANGAAAPVGAPSAGGVPRRRVMLVDDNVDMLESLRELLELQGHDVYALADPASALSLARSIRPDLAILDIGLPGMDGYELAAELRRQPALAGTRLVALSGYGQQADRQRSSAAGFSRHLVKPVDPAQLRALLEDAAAG
ncbi:ATP-binding protein [Pseudoduganella namucuonensis]|uniref:histidine kinase n=1 Tax=Pseudoduganella namucuonensis TaxID=1035707 RepID=A0A1I7JQG2_9BURK|nr:ATP-binding protein [Pseudoduganella namucuonensis]SFU87421.1 Signal transduction histidine kinase [Pseudoduganella namucuonensis]